MMMILRMCRCYAYVSDVGYGYWMCVFMITFLCMFSILVMCYDAVVFHVYVRCAYVCFLLLCCVVVVLV